MTGAPWDAIVVGGGCAGLSSATLLAEKGAKVLVLERRPLLGGRASSFHDTESGETLDNGQHLFLGCYRETKEYLRRIGTLDRLAFHDTFDAPMAGPDGERARLKTTPWPAPFHVAWALLRYRALTFRDRLGTFRVALAALKNREGLDRLSVSAWLSELGQSRESRDRLWDPITLATLNIHPDLAPADLLAVVLREGFLASREATRVGLSTVGLSELHGEPSRRWLQAKGSDVRLKMAVKSVRRAERLWHVQMVDEKFEVSKTLILAIPPPALLKLMEASEPGLKEFARPVENLQPSPILSMHVWFDRDPFTEPLFGFWGREFHWAFRKSAFSRDLNQRHYSFVISAADRMFQKTKEELIRICQDEVRTFSGIDCRITRAVLVRESEATWVPSLTSDVGRLKTRTPFSNLFLAGDWTATGLPATIEGAVKSGHRAAVEAFKGLGVV